ncbi:olfactory receptor 52Z1P-like [Periophthalmus magnuspinnatus]|uniref:olfactory receptor 52Z1P-like n=1 Tax=Periophthalmus magnuspinnatus TaxID=409849 RepID=UPI0024374304|nr:olfactory receptor 52Z1P-like [Periophthalmus magnuspinnatus]
MLVSNGTNLKHFVMVGFPGLSSVYFGPVSVLLLFVFLAIIVGNAFTVAVIYLIKSLHKPTYIIFVNLAMTDIIFAIVTLPKVISRYWWDDTLTLFGTCFTQMYFVHSMGSITSLILLLMALDRFIAVWFPLRYPTVVNNRSISIACFLCWCLTFIRMVGVVSHALTLPYCGIHGNIIPHCYCDHLSITQLGCGNEVKYVKVVSLGIALFGLLMPLAFIIFSYFSVIVAVIKMSQAESRYRVLSTCAPQIFITCLYYVPRCFVYIAHNLGLKIGQEIQVVIVMLYSFVPAIVNPLIYCFKTKDIKDALSQRLKRRRTYMGCRHKSTHI